MDKLQFFQRVANLHKLPMQKLNRNWIVVGQKRRVGKSQMIQDLYDSLCEYPHFPEHPQKWDHMKADFINPDEKGDIYKEYAYVEQNVPTIAGFKTGDLRRFNYEQ